MHNLNEHPMYIPRMLHLSLIISHGSIYIQVNEKSCRLRMGAYRDRVKMKGDKIVMGL